MTGHGMLADGSVGSDSSGIGFPITWSGSETFLGLVWDSPQYTFVIGLSLWICGLGLILLKSREKCIDL